MTALCMTCNCWTTKPDEIGKGGLCKRYPPVCILIPSSDGKLTLTAVRPNMAANDGCREHQSKAQENGQDK